MKVTCSKCSENLYRRGQRTCIQCHSEYMRKWRKEQQLTRKQMKAVRHFMATTH